VDSIIAIFSVLVPIVALIAGIIAYARGASQGEPERIRCYAEWRCSRSTWTGRDEI
jgi:hypothetical protein